MIKKRSIALMIFLSIITFGIYPLVMMCIMGDEVNRICDGDGKHNSFYLLAGLLGLVTFGIVPVVWCAKAMNRLQDNAYRYGPAVNPRHSGNSYILWLYVGSFIGIGPFVAWAYFVSDINEFADVYGRIVPLEYTPDRAQRIFMLENANFSGNNMNALNQGGYSPAPQIENNGQKQLPDMNAGTAYNPMAGYQANDAHSFGADNAGVTAGRRSQTGVIRGVSGMYQGFDFPIEHNEEISIGCDPSAANIIIDDEGSYISPVHCVIRYDAMQCTYLVTDYSSSGTFTADGARLSSGIPKMINRGESVYLATTQNTFQLG